jgi:oligoendopeptidase F
MADTLLTLSETTPVLGEMLMFRAFAGAHNRSAAPQGHADRQGRGHADHRRPADRPCTFEERVHGERREADLAPNCLGEIWPGVQRESLGTAIRLDGVYRHYWSSYIPHFIHAPFYVYACALGDSLVNSLYAVYEDKGFAERYLGLLRGRHIAPSRAVGAVRSRCRRTRPFGPRASRGWRA